MMQKGKKDNDKSYEASIDFIDTRLSELLQLIFNNILRK